LNLEAAGWPVFLPLATRRVFIRNMAVEQAQPLFGPYLFTAFDLELDHWRPINNAHGVVRLLPKHLEEPLAMPDALVERWRDRYEAGEFRAQDVLGYELGDLVLVTGGIWKDKAGVFAGSDRGGLQY
jgi:transcription antitermination factor NusG